MKSRRRSSAGSIIYLQSEKMSRRVAIPLCSYMKDDENVVGESLSHHPEERRRRLIFIFICLASIPPSDNHPILDIGDSEDVPGSGEDRYSFSWSVSYEFPSEEDVKDESVEFGQEESRDGDFTEGSYFVQLPGNRLQTVEYFVRGDSGFVAKVRVISNVSAELEGGEEE